jgi:hypothetical protein
MGLDAACGFRQKGRMRSLFACACVILSLAGCHSLEASAAKDPMKCERDPKCAKHDKAFDCSTQCADDPACVDRCREVNQQTGTAEPR